ncbi:unnamed protein product [Camellia sinensis]
MVTKYFAELFGGSDYGGKSGRFGENGSKNSNGNQTIRKAAPVENKLVCSSEELYKGSRKNVKILRIVPDDSGYYPNEDPEFDSAYLVSLSL